MSIFGKFFGKKKDIFDVGDPMKDTGAAPGAQTPGFNEPLGSPDAGAGFEGAPPTHTPTGSFSPEAMGFERVTEKSSGLPSHEQRLGEINIGKDLEVISAKLDSIKAELDSMNQRMKRLERIAEGESSTHRDKWSY